MTSLGVSQPILLGLQAHLVKETLGSHFVILCTSHDFSGKNVVPVQIQCLCVGGQVLDCSVSNINQIKLYLLLKSE